MTNVHGYEGADACPVLLAHRRVGASGRWVWGSDDPACASDLRILHAYSGTETLDRVARGGIAAAVLVGDAREIDGLSLLRIIRGVDDELPCWLVAESVTRPWLQTALSLRATSVFVSPFDPAELWFAVRRVVSETPRRARDRDRSTIEAGPVSEKPEDLTPPDPRPGLT